MGPERQVDIRNGLRSSPAVDGDSSATDGSEGTSSDVRMRVGSMYQAEIPTYAPDQQTKADRAMTVWAPCSEESLTEQDISEYLALAKEKHGYNAEQALGMLYWHGHSLSKARADLAQFTPVPDEWSVQDKNLFEQAFLFHGKSFHRIKQMLPEKTIGSLVKYYYSWKKTRSKTSMMDAGRPENPMNSSSTDSSDTEMAVLGRRFERRNKKSSARAGRTDRGSRRRGRTHCIRINKEDLSAIMTGASEAISQRLLNEQSDLLHKVQQNKQALAAAQAEAVCSIDEFRVTASPVKTSPVWSENERLLAVQAVSEFGNDPDAISEVLGTKTAAHVRSFFTLYNKQYDLDALCKAHLRRQAAEEVPKAKPSADVSEREPDC